MPTFKSETDASDSLLKEDTLCVGEFSRTLYFSMYFPLYESNSFFEIVAFSFMVLISLLNESSKQD